MNWQNNPNLWDRALASIPGGVNSPVRSFAAVGGKPFFVQHGKGSIITDTNNKEYVDFVGTWGASILGHASPIITEAISRSCKSGISFGIPHPIEIEMAEFLCESVPAVEKVRMTNSGTEAVMTAIRLARGFTKREKILKFEGCYHGHVDALLVKAGSGVLTMGEPDSSGIPHVLSQLTAILPFNSIDSLSDLFNKIGYQLAAVILEPIPANAGLYLPDHEFLYQLRKLCSEYGVLLIFDEVITGFRVALGGAQEIYNILPDLVTLGKIIGGGLPIGAVGGKKEIMDYLSPLGSVYQAGTLSGNPIALSAGLAQLQEIKQIDVWKKLEKLGVYFDELVIPLLDNYPICFQRIGSIFCFYFCEQIPKNLTQMKQTDIERFRLFFHSLLEQGIYIAPSPFEVGFLNFSHTDSHIEKLCESILLTVKKIF